LIGDLVVDAKSGVSGAGREPKLETHFGELNESVKAYGLGGHRHLTEIRQELRVLGVQEAVLDGLVFTPHLVPMTRGLLATCYVRPTRSIDQAELDRLYRDAYELEPCVDVASAAPPTKSVTGSNLCRVFVRLDERSGRIVALGAIDNLVKGAAGQAVQAFNICAGLDETAGLEQLPLYP
jgi:N-acetyl-gamma-glutamyl-phosphate reductase